MARSKRSSKRASRLIAGDPVAVEKVKRGFATIGKGWDRDLRVQFERERAVHEIQTRFNRPILQLLSEDPGSVAALGSLRQMSTSAFRPKLSSQKAWKSFPPTKAYMALTLAPPFDYAMVWPSDGSVQVGADRDLGEMQFDIQTSDVADATSFMAVAALGVSYQATETGILQISADPGGQAFAGAWSGGFGGKSHAEDWLDMAVDRYELNGDFDARVLDQKTTILASDAWSGWEEMGKLIAFPSIPSDHTAGVAGILSVDPGYNYVLWVWCGGRVSGQGWRTNGMWTDKARASMRITVPSINISLSVTS